MAARLTSVVIHLTKRVLPLNGNAGAQIRAVLKGGLVTDIPVAHHLQKSALRQIHLAAVPLLLPGRQRLCPCRLRVQRFQPQLLPGEGVVYHHHIADEHGIGHDGQFRQDAQKLPAPRQGFPAVGELAEGGAHLTLRRGRIEDRADHEDRALLEFGLNGDGPLHPDRGADDLRSGPLAKADVSQGLLQAPQDLKAPVQQGLLPLRTAGGDPGPVFPIAPDIELLRPGDNALQKEQILLSLRHPSIHLFSRLSRIIVLSKRILSRFSAADNEKRTDR